jgi:hypothetical protein
MCTCEFSLRRESFDVIIYDTRIFYDAGVTNTSSDPPYAHGWDQYLAPDPSSIQ